MRGASLLASLAVALGLLSCAADPKDGPQSEHGSMPQNIPPPTSPQSPLPRMMENR